VRGSDHFGSFCGNQNVYLKVLNQNGSQFRLHYVGGGLADKVGITYTYGTSLEARHDSGAFALCAPPEATCL